MLGMLAEVLPHNYPTDYLLARLRVRAENRAAAGETGGGPRPGAAGDDSQIWDHLRQERCWLYSQLNTDLHRILAPLFAYLETGTVALVLRFLAAGRPEDASLVLEGSLLGSELKAVLRTQDSVPGLLARLEHFFRRQGTGMKGLRAGFEENGLAGSEEQIRAKILSVCLERSRHPTITSFLRDLVDMRNLLALARRLRWQESSGPAFLEGGRLRISFSTNPPVAEDLVRIAGHWTGGNGPEQKQLHPVALESVLRSHLLRKISRQRVQGDPVAACIEYLWRLAEQTRQLSRHFHGSAGGDFSEEEGS